jgi:WD40 repeat protein
MAHIQGINGHLATRDVHILKNALNFEGDDSGEWPEEHWSVPKNARMLPCEDVNVFEQGFPTVDEDDDADDAENDDDRYFRRYNEHYYSSNLDGGFFCLAIAPDTTRILSGSNDAEIYVIDSTTLQVLHCKREYGNCKTVTGCHFNPLFGHEEFAVCNEMGIFDIWNITASDDDGREEVKRIHRLKFPPGTSNCVYSPDGQFIALTSAKESKTYIISSTSAMVMFTLLYPVEENPEFRHETYFLSSSLFFGNSCQVATVHEDRVICSWKLPVIYSLKTLCLILLRASIKYNDIDQLCVPNSLKELLKYLYV